MADVKSRGGTAIYLTTDDSNNEAVNAFYRKCGFRIERQYVTPEGRSMNEYWIDVVGKNFLRSDFLHVRAENCVDHDIA